jgi:hypothetical protein
MLLCFKCKPLYFKCVTSFTTATLSSFCSKYLRTVLKQQCKTVMQLESLLVEIMQGCGSLSGIKFLAVLIVLIEAFKGKQASEVLPISVMFYTEVMNSHLDRRITCMSRVLQLCNLGNTERHADCTPLKHVFCALFQLNIYYILLFIWLQLGFSPVAVVQQGHHRQVTHITQGNNTFNQNTIHKKQQ